MALPEKAITLFGCRLHTHHLLNKVWGAEYREEREYLHVFVGRLRTKFEPDPANPIYFITVTGVGYQFTDST